jgi:hypothetical protein
MDLRYEACCFADPLFFDEQRDAGVPRGSFTQECPRRRTAGSSLTSGKLITIHPTGVPLTPAAALGGHGTVPPFLEPSRIAASPVPTGQS